MILNKIRRKVRDAASDKYTNKIDVSWIAGEGLYNHACHLNSVNKVMSGEAAAVVEVVMISGDSCTAHYINLMPDGRFVDFTLGWHYAGCDYRLVRYVPKTEWDSISKSLDALKVELCKPVATMKKLLLINDGQIC